MEDELLTKTEAAALLKSSTKAIEESVRDGSLTKVVIPRVGKRYWKSEVLGLPLKLSATKTAKLDVSTAVSTSLLPASPPRTHDERILGTPGTPAFEAAAHANAWWATTCLDALFRVTRLRDEPDVEWPALVATPYFGPELAGGDGVLLRWDTRSKMTPEFVLALLRGDMKKALSELSRMHPKGACEFAEMKRLGLVSDDEPPALPRRAR